MSQGRAPDPAIATQDLSKAFGSLQAVDSLNLTVERGEIFGFLGPNGAGKSTTIRMLLGFLHPTGGSARMIGLDIQLQRAAILRRTGYLPSSVSFDDTVTGAQALHDLARLSESTAPRRAEIAERVDLPAETLARRVRDYSRGTRQKLGIVQALQHDPDLAIFDEPTEGLDPLVQHSFCELLEDLRREGKTIFFSSHVLSEVEQLCDRVGIIRGGRLVATDSVASLLAHRRRRVELRFRGPPPDLEHVPGVSSIESAPGLLRLSLQGDVGPFLRAIAATEVTDLLIEPAHLEDVFLEMYQPHPTDAPS
jgi:ABC-2 type transport system ATP-binding protein